MEDAHRIVVIYMASSNPTYRT